jgi:hypothetical protein
MSGRRALEWPRQDKGGPRHDALLAMVHASNRGEVRMGGGEGGGAEQAAGALNSFNQTITQRFELLP